MVGLTIVTSVSSIIIYSFHFTFFLWTHGVGIIVTFPICWLEKQNLESWINCPDLFSEYVMNIFWTKPLVISQLWVASILPRRPFFCISYSLYSFAGAPMPWFAQWTDTCFLTIPEASCLRPGCWKGWFWGLTHWLTDGCFLTRSLKW